jgi:hypothetical protein
MPKESKPNKKKRIRQDVRVEDKAIRTLRTLNNEEAFYFYENINKPTGQSARSLNEFLEKVKSVKLESLVFHLERNDFKNWIKNTLEDPKLAQKIEMLPIEHKDQLRTKICATVKAHLKELEGTSVRIDELYLSHSGLAH